MEDEARDSESGNYYSRHRSVVDLRTPFRFPELPNLEPRYVVRPTNTEHVVAIGKDGERHFIPMRWGLVPPWTKALKGLPDMFNARSETILEKSSFATPMKKGRRCLVPLDGFFEFSGPKGAKQPHYFKPKNDRVLAFAGLWESWKGPAEAPLDSPMLSYTIATTTPNATVAPFHNRMPVLLSEAAQWDVWLDPDTPTDALAGMLAPAPDDLLIACMVSPGLLRNKDLDASSLAPI